MWNDEVLRSLITSNLWRYGPWGSTNMAMLRFAPNGKVSWYRHYNEAKWTLENGKITIYHIDGMETVRFDEVHVVDRKIYFVGDLLLYKDSNSKMALTAVDFDDITLPIALPAVNLEEVSNCRLLISLCFHFRAVTIKYLLQVMRGYFSFTVEQLDFVIYTNAADEDYALLERSIAQCFTGQCNHKISLKSVADLEDPWLLPWQHRKDFKETFLDNQNYTHYIYSEDDLVLNFSNFIYFLRFLPVLKPFGLIPAFSVTEYGNDGQVYAKEQPYKIDLSLNRRVVFDGLSFINLDNPYNALYILDKEMGWEFFNSASFDLEASKTKTVWGIAERAAMGLSHENIPDGFFSKYVVPLDHGTKTFPYYATLEHLPNKYVNEPNSAFGKITLDKLFE